MGINIELGEKQNKFVKILVIIFIIISVLPVVMTLLFVGGMMLFGYFLFGHYDIITTDIGYYSPTAVEIQEYNGRVFTYDEYVELCERYGEKPMFSSEDNKYACAVIDSAHKPKINSVSWSDETFNMTITLHDKHNNSKDTVCQFLIYKVSSKVGSRANISVGVE